MTSTHLLYRVELIFLAFAVPSNAYSWITRNVNLTVCQTQTARFNWHIKLSSDEQYSQLLWGKKPKTDIVAWDGSTFVFVDGEYQTLVTPFLNGTLILRPCMKDHSGTYVIQISVKNNKTGSWKSDTSTGQLLVRDLTAPSYSNEESPNGSSILPKCKELSCFPQLETLGEPPVQVVWKVNGEVINVSSCESADKGDYSCELTGEALECLPPDNFLRQPYVFKSSESRNSTIVITVVVVVFVLIGVAIPIAIWWKKKLGQKKTIHSQVDIKLG